MISVFLKSWRRSCSEHEVWKAAKQTLKTTDIFFMVYRLLSAPILPLLNKVNHINVQFDPSLKNNELMSFVTGWNCGVQSKSLQRADWTRKVTESQVDREQLAELCKLQLVAQRSSEMKDYELITSFQIIEHCQHIWSTDLCVWISFRSVTVETRRLSR